jgi:hypothetical protein
MNSKQEPNNKISNEEIVIRIRIPRFAIKFIRYLVQNPGALFIIAFQVMLIYTAILLSIGASNLANEIAVRAYYSLVIGVILQLVSYLKSKDKEK